MYVKSPVASLCFACSSVRNLVRVMMSVWIFSGPVPVAYSPLPLVAMFVQVDLPLSLVKGTVSGLVHVLAGQIWSSRLPRQNGEGTTGAGMRSRLLH